MVHASTTPAGEVLAIIGWLTERGIVYQINGGWGVDALVGRQTREHGDLDVFVDANIVPDLIEWLASRGYEPVTDWLPIRIELASERGRVDVHPWSSSPTGMVSNKALKSGIHASDRLPHEGIDRWSAGHRRHGRAAA